MTHIKEIVIIKAAGEEGETLAYSQMEQLVD